MYSKHIEDFLLSRANTQMVLIMNSVDYPKLHKKLNNSCHK